jgi:hypothetical protein
MKYFTQELLNRLNSKDLGEAENASDAWESVAAEYRSHLAKIEAQLPKPLSKLFNEHYLHDARVAFAGQLGPDSFSVILTLDAPPHVSLLLSYRRIDKVTMCSHGALDPDRLVPYQWLYDEVQVIDEGRSGLLQPFRKKHFQHSILLTNGLEVQIAFQDFAFSVLPDEAIVSGAGLSRIPQYA